MLRCLALTLTATLVVSVVRAEPSITLKQGDRIVFLGDSITYGASGPQGYITLIQNQLKEQKPDLGVEVFNAGIMPAKSAQLPAQSVGL